MSDLENGSPAAPKKHWRSGKWFIVAVVAAIIAVVGVTVAAVFAFWDTVDEAVSEQASISAEDAEFAAATEKRYTNVFGPDMYPAKFEAISDTPVPVPVALTNNSDIAKVVTAAATRGNAITVVNMDDPISSSKPATANECVTALNETVNGNTEKGCLFSGKTTQLPVTITAIKDKYVLIS